MLEKLYKSGVSFMMTIVDRLCRILSYNCLFEVCHTLISSEDHPLLGCDPRLTTSRYLAPIVRKFVKFRDMPEAKRKVLYIAIWSTKKNVDTKGLSLVEYCCIKVSLYPTH